MNPKETKTGQSIDLVKTTVINPVLVERVLEIPNLERVLSVIDIGSGDGTSSRAVIKALSEKGYAVENLALVDADTKIFPDLVETTTFEPPYSLNTQVLEFRDRDILSAFLERFEGVYDIAIAQLVFQQIHTVPEASYLMHSAYWALKPAGELLLVDLHPKYIQYLVDQAPAKFEVLQRGGDGLMGRYHFDSGGSVEIHSRVMAIQLAMLLGVGFDLVNAASLSTDSIIDKKERYHALTQEKIPMFYMMQLRKNPANFVSGTTGVVEAIKPHTHGWVSVTFADGDEIMVPGFNNWEDVKKGSHLVLHETYRPEVEKQIVNYWVIDGEKVTGGQLVASQKQ